MPDDRILSSRHGHGDRSSCLTDLEFRVWEQYLHSADDFGVMRYSHFPIQSDNAALAKRPKGIIQRALDAIVTIRLVVPFTHQQHTFVCQLDWQDYQRKTYTKKTQLPTPPPDLLARCTAATRHLFGSHPGGGKVAKFQKEFQKLSENLPEIVREPSENILATREILTLTLTPNANTHAHADEDWQAFQDAYPKHRREGGFMAVQGFLAACTAIGFALLMARLDRQKCSEQWKKGMVPQMGNYFQRELWRQEPDDVAVPRVVGQRVMVPSHEPL